MLLPFGNFLKMFCKLLRYISYRWYVCTPRPAVLHSNLVAQKYF